VARVGRSSPIQPRVGRRAVQPAPSNPKISTLTDTFDTALDTETWYRFGSAPGAVVSGGRLEVGYTGADWAGVRAPVYDWYDLTDSFIFGRVWPQTTWEVGRETNFRLQNADATNWIGFIFTNNPGYITMLLREDTTNDNIDLNPYDPVAHAWIRVRLTGTTAYWDTSPDGVNWTNRRSRVVTPSKFTAVELELSAGQATDYGVYPKSYYDNVNVPGVGPKFNVWNGLAWVSKPAKTWDGSAWTDKPIKRWTGSSWVDI
jgi:hypothetical protein